MNTYHKVGRSSKCWNIWTKVMASTRTIVHVLHGYKARCTKKHLGAWRLGWHLGVLSLVHSNKTVKCKRHGHFPDIREAS